ncbi:MAG: hypothetical protein CUR33_09145 [Pseudomonas sp.]|uniref:glycosyltransferase n=1 Tax=Pseudomonas sp. FEMGT703P TaxID=2080764 RepID=UPI000CADFA93|nr:glycosyltransferase [Pseudomonas sp. FEMGT703P]PJE43432.1 MAG: hypothetical protein CUR33_09145 [Pseudomonas sp.] [Pseudomonas sp. FEMGT703P]
MQRVLLLSFSTLVSDPRVRRHALALADSYYVVTAGYGEAPGYGNEHIQIPRPTPTCYFKKFLKAVFLLLRVYSPVYWLDDDKRAALKLLKSLEAFDLVIANDAPSLPVAFFSAGTSVPVVADMHEFAPGEQLPGWKWNLFWKGYPQYLCRRFLPRANHVLTVCDSIAELYRQEFLVTLPGVLMNCPSYLEAVPKEVGEKIRLIHHGAGCPSRKLELMAEAALLLDERFEFDFMLVESDSAYCSWLKETYEGQRIRFREPVPMPLISEVLNRDYDIGVFLLEPEAISYKYALPNKLFEFMQARLAVVVSPNHEMARLVRSTSVGVVSEDFSSASLARAINALDEATIMSMKRASAVAAQRYCAETVYSDFKRLADAFTR